MNVDSLTTITILATILTWSLLVGIMIFLNFGKRGQGNPNNNHNNPNNNEIFSKIGKIDDLVSKVENIDLVLRDFASRLGVLEWVLKIKNPQGSQGLKTGQGRVYNVLLEQVFDDIELLGKEDAKELGKQIRRLEKVIRAMKKEGCFDDLAKERVVFFLERMKEKWKKDEDMREVFVVEQSSVKSVAAAPSLRQELRKGEGMGEVFIVQKEKEGGGEGEKIKELEEEIKMLKEKEKGSEKKGKKDGKKGRREKKGGRGGKEKKIEKGLKGKDRKKKAGREERKVKRKRESKGKGKGRGWLERLRGKK